MKQISRLFTILIALLLGGLLAACQFVPEQGDTTVTIVADGTTQVMVVESDLTVSDVLRGSGISLGELDRVNPPGYSRVSDGMTITVVRVVEETIVEREEVAFQRQTVPNDGMAEGETRLLQPGVNGIAEVTYRITYENGGEVSRSEIRRILIEPAQDEVIMVGSQTDLPTVTVNGTLAYISSGNAWIIRQNSANHLPLTVDGGLDGKVFELSDDGKRLVYTKSLNGDDEEAFNALWVILDMDDTESEPVRLDLENILFSAWVPGVERTIVYSTAEPRSTFPGWQANNDLWRAQISATGGLVQQEQLLEASSGGIYGWYGTTYTFSPDGVTLAWAQPDAVGVLLPEYGGTGDDEEAGDEEEEDDESESPTGLPTGYTRLTIAIFAPWNAYDFIWVPTPAWAPDGLVFAAATHGEPMGSEVAEDSPVFNLSIFPYDGWYSVNVVEQVGMWAEPRYSPAETPDGEELDVSLAYLQAINPLDSAFSRTRLVVMDRDGSNERVVFPSDERPGLLPQQIAWSPDGGQIAVIDPGPEGDLFLVDVVTGRAQQITTDGQSSNPRWVP
ncbi:MAG: G5 domain-containing protein [Anaerolineae bacterium]|nr:G5 domain-containing protein [Anaerolineae bacterium]